MQTLKKSAVDREAVRQKRLAALPIIPVDVDGTVVNVIVCWPHERVAEYMKAWPAGSVDLAARLDPAYKGPGTPQDGAWLAATARALAGKARLPDALAALMHGGNVARALRTKLPTADLRIRSPRT